MSQEAIDAALRGRKSVRGYRPEPIARARLDTLFATAQRAPSWCNIQPWRVALTAPPLTGQVAAALTEAARSGMPHPDIPYPLDYPEPYLAHRRACGHALYGAMGIGRDHKERRYDAWLRNYALFDAPHLAVVSRHRVLGEYATLDIGVWLGVLVVTAAAMGIDCCPMAAVAAYPEPLRRLLPIADDQVILFGVTLGTEDPEVPANACRTSRDPVAANVQFLGF
jgi:nitroreductase